jgi:ATP-dependent Lon protease
MASRGDDMEALEGSSTPEFEREAKRAGGPLALRPVPEDALIIVPLRNAVLFPGAISPITVGRASSVAAAKEAARSEKKVGFLLQRDPKQD